MTFLGFLKVVLVIALLAFITAGIAGPLGIFAMGDHEHGDCPFMSGEMALCMTTILHSLSLWQRTLATLLPETLLLVIFLLAFAYLFAVFRDPAFLKEKNIQKSWRKLFPKQITLFLLFLLQSSLSPRAP